MVFFFIGFPENQVIVLKASSTVLSDAIAYDIAILLGLPVPKYRLIWFKKGPEYWDIEKTLERLSLNENTMGIIQSITKDIPILMLMEYINGVTPNKLPVDILNVSNNWGYTAYNHMGKMIAYDILINNWDRFPFLWRKEEGNCDNFLFSPSSPIYPVYGIDQSITSIDPLSSNLSQYLCKIDSVISEILSFKFTNDYINTVPTIIKGVFMFLKEDTGIDYTMNEVGCLIGGLIEGILLIGGINKASIENIYKCYQQEAEDLCQRMIWGQDFRGLYGLSKVNISFLFSIIQLYQKYEARLLIQQIEISSYFSNYLLSNSNKIQ